MTDENRLESRHVVIDDHLIGTRDSICLVADVKGDRFKEVMIASMSGRSNLVWYEIPSDSTQPFYPNNQVDLCKNVTAANGPERLETNITIGEDPG